MGRSSRSNDRSSRRASSHDGTHRSDQRSRGDGSRSSRLGRLGEKAVNACRPRSISKSAHSARDSESSPASFPSSSESRRRSSSSLAPVHHPPSQPSSDYSLMVYLGDIPENQRGELLERLRAENPGPQCRLFYETDTSRPGQSQDAERSDQGIRTGDTGARRGGSRSGRGRGRSRDRDTRQGRNDEWGRTTDQYSRSAPPPGWREGYQNSPQGYGAPAYHGEPYHGIQSQAAGQLSSAQQQQYPSEIDHSRLAQLVPQPHPLHTVPTSTTPSQCPSSPSCSAPLTTAGRATPPLDPVPTLTAVSTIATGTTLPTTAPSATPIQPDDDVKNHKLLEWILSNAGRVAAEMATQNASISSTKTTSALTPSPAISFPAPALASVPVN